MIPFDSLLIFYLAIYAASSAADVGIEKINTIYLKKHAEDVPLGFKGLIDQEELIKIKQYTIDKTRFNMIHACISKMFFLFIILSGLLPWLARSLSDVNFVGAGLIFFAVPGLLAAAIDLPFDYYRSFVIEERHGFNTSTLKTWFSDLAKSLMLTAVIGSFLLASLLLMIQYAGHVWWIWACSVFIGFQLLMTVIHPTLIAPLFNKFTPIEDHALTARIKELTGREGLSIQGIYQMDAARRSRHTNAYFSGLGKQKRIVLFDTLIQSHNTSEIVAVLAHEIGHLKRNHIKKNLAITGMASIAFFYLASKMITWETMFHNFGFSDMPVYVGLFLVGVLWEPFGFCLSPLVKTVSRKFEHEADLYCIRLLKTADPLIKALRKMAKENLANLQPHPLYVWFNYSHPPLLQRIKGLESATVATDVFDA
ncbi:MAG: M48 family metallopeptidase [Thermodesulfobacteriota bacterium]|nr:M48 family metallopeptidase [Thermodesulfobacteriota bacterium]